MKIKLILLINILSIKLLADTSLLVMPFCSSNVGPAQVALLENAVSEIIFTKKSYSPALSEKTKMMIMDRTDFNHCDYFMEGSSENNFFQVIESVKVDEVLSCAVDYKNGQYGLYLKLKSSVNGTLIKSDAIGYTGDFQQLLNKDLEEILHDFLDLRKKKNHHLSFAVSAGYLQNYEDYMVGGKFGFGSDQWGEFSLEANLYTEKFAENISFVYTTPLKYWLFLKLGAGFTSESKNGFTLTKYEGAPAANEISSMQHSAGALAAIGISVPLSQSFRINTLIESDLIYSKWTTFDDQNDEGLIYSYYPEIEISWQIKF